jgi:hypothetical protein
VFRPGNFLLSHTLARAVQSGLRGLTAVFGMGTGGSLSLESPRRSGLNIDGPALRNRFLTGRGSVRTLCMNSKFYGQAERAISNGQLNVLLRLHTRPIKLVVYQCSYYLLRLGDLILRKVSRLYAFSVYPNRTSLPSYAPGGTTGTQEVRSPRSSRTKGKPPQISYAHHR